MCHTGGPSDQTIDGFKLNGTEALEGHLLLITYHLLLTTFYLLLTNYYLLLTTYYLSYHLSPL